MKAFRTITQKDYAGWLRHLRLGQPVSVWRKRASGKRELRQYNEPIFKLTDQRVTVLGESGSYVLFDRQTGREVTGSATRYILPIWASSIESDGLTQNQS